MQAGAVNIGGLTTGCKVLFMYLSLHPCPHTSSHCPMDTDTNTLSLSRQLIDTATLRRQVGTQRAVPANHSTTEWTYRSNSNQGFFFSLFSPLILHG